MPDKPLEPDAPGSAAPLDLTGLDPQQVAAELQRLSTAMQRQRKMLDSYYAAIVRLTRLIGGSGREDLVEEAQQILGTLVIVLDGQNQADAAGPSPPGTPGASGGRAS